MPFISDPQGREEVEKVSRRLKLPVWKSYCKGDFRKWWNEWWDKIDIFAEEIEENVENVFTLLKGNTGIAQVKNIEELGTKIKGEIYWDNSVTPKVPYLCVKTTEDITPTSNFITADNKNLAKDVYEETFIIEIGNPVQHELTFRKVGKVIIVFCNTRGGSINAVLDTYVVPENFRPSANTYITYSCISGNPYIKIGPDGKLSSRDNGATMHTLQSTTSYFITQVYISVTNI